MNQARKSAMPIEQEQSSRAPRAEDLREFGARLNSVSVQARKLLAHVAELAYHGRGRQRKPDVAYLPELHESCGLDVDAMYSLLRELEAAKFIAVEDRYPFEDVKVASDAFGRNLLCEIARSAEGGKVALRAVLVDLQFDALL
jgi:hypothetical protein